MPKTVRRLRNVPRNELKKAAEAYNREEIVRRDRTECTVCGATKKYHQLEPGTGRCTECMP